MAGHAVARQAHVAVELRRDQGQLDLVEASGGERDSGSPSSAAMAASS